MKHTQTIQSSKSCRVKEVKKRTANLACSFRTRRMSNLPVALMMRRTSAWGGVAMDSNCSPPVRCGLLDFYVSCLTSSSSSSSLLLLLHVVLNREPRLAAFPARPKLRGSRGSVPCRTSTASSAWQRSPPDLNRELRLAAWQCSPSDLIRESEDMPDRTSESLSERMSEDFPERMSEDTPERTSEVMPEKEC